MIKNFYIIFTSFFLTACSSINVEEGRSIFDPPEGSEEPGQQRPQQIEDPEQETKSDHPLKINFPIDGELVSKDILVEGQCYPGRPVFLEGDWLPTEDSESSPRQIVCQRVSKDLGTFELNLRLSPPAGTKDLLFYQEIESNDGIERISIPLSVELAEGEYIFEILNPIQNAQLSDPNILISGRCYPGAEVSVVEQDEDNPTFTDCTIEGNFTTSIQLDGSPSELNPRKIQVLQELNGELLERTLNVYWLNNNGLLSIQSPSFDQIEEQYYPDINIEIRCTPGGEQVKVSGDVTNASFACPPSGNLILENLRLYPAKQIDESWVINGPRRIEVSQIQSNGTQVIDSLEVLFKCPEDIVQISTPVELRDRLKEEPCRSFELTNDINLYNLTQIPFNNRAESGFPIFGNGVNAFFGSLNGNGHKIRGFNLHLRGSFNNQSGEYNYSSAASLFGHLEETALIENLTIDRPQIRTGTGSVVAQQNHGELRNIKIQSPSFYLKSDSSNSALFVIGNHGKISDVDIVGAQFVVDPVVSPNSLRYDLAGLVLSNYGQIFRAKIQSLNFVFDKNTYQGRFGLSGLVGNNYNLITQSAAYIGDAFVTDSSAGLVGRQADGAIITKSFASLHDFLIIGNNPYEIGGFVGEMLGESHIEDSYVVGRIRTFSGSNYGRSTGGLVGRYQGGEIKHFLVGLTNNLACDDNNRICRQAFLGTTDDPQLNSSNFQGIYVDESKTPHDARFDFIEMKTTQELEIEDTYVNWDFEGIWMPPEQGNYPTLR